MAVPGGERQHGHLAAVVDGAGPEPARDSLADALPPPPRAHAQQRPGGLDSPADQPVGRHPDRAPGRGHHAGDVTAVPRAALSADDRRVGAGGARSDTKGKARAEEEHLDPNPDVPVASDEDVIDPRLREPAPAPLAAVSRAQEMVDELDSADEDSVRTEASRSTNPTVQTGQHPRAPYHSGGRAAGHLARSMPATLAARLLLGANDHAAPGPPPANVIPEQQRRKRTKRARRTPGLPAHLGGPGAGAAPGGSRATVGGAAGRAGGASGGTDVEPKDKLSADQRVVLEYLRSSHWETAPMLAEIRQAKANMTLDQCRRPVEKLIDYATFIARVMEHPLPLDPKYRMSSPVLAAWTGFGVDWIQNAYNVSRHMHVHEGNPALDDVLEAAMNAGSLGMAKLVESLKARLGALRSARAGV